MIKTKYKICIIGLGYVGLPLAIEFSKKYSVIGYDINLKRVKELKSFQDSTLEVESKELEDCIKSSFDLNNSGLFITNDIDYLKECNFYIITVPTPIDQNKHPVFKPLISASMTVGKILKKDDIVVYESTVYPGATEEICLPILESESKLKLNDDFHLGYSPERINPGDKKYTLTKIKKITSGSSKAAGLIIDNLYGTIIKAGTHLAETIKVAEAAKVIENSQRDINIAFVNELSKIFDLLDVDTNSVLKAAGTKWNFLPFRPGLVGGHCIGVDPYYLAEKAIQVGYNPEIILSGRRINDSMGKFIFEKFLKNVIKSEKIIKKSNFLIMGVTFKENCPDVRNSGVISVLNQFKKLSLNFSVYDPWADKLEVKKEFGFSLIDELKSNHYDGVIIAVAHEIFKKIKIKSLIRDKDSTVFDVKGIYNNNSYLSL